jgi:nicotinate-nucleotide adenylyltransferase
VLKTIGLFGGSFDPIHNGHLQLLQTLHTQIPLPEIRLIPCAQSALRNPPMASAIQRIEIIKRAIEKMPWLSLDDREIQRGGVSYTIDTLRSIRLDMPHAALCCIMSMDQFIQFHRWKAWEEIPELAHLIVANRPGYVASFEGALQACITKRATDTVALLQTTPAGAIFFQKIPEVPISSTAIRAGLRAGKNVSSLLPEKVEEYIHSEKLYL